MPATYLTTSFKHREQVKALGARWDPQQRQWYVPSGLDLAPFGAWLPDAAAANQSAPPGSVTVATGMPVDTAAGAKLGIGLSQLLAGVAQAVAKAFASGV